ncbi:MAG TPA: acetyl-CoA carboxylase carboxyl transferase subunit beta [Eubacteriaceae bacterium]|nr:acetyl-CoA carboxylase carboxyl transferase subunit beta [Eubacteriaceae bacterium]
MFDFLRKNKSINASFFTQKDVPKKLYTKCPSCEEMIYYEDLQRTSKICPSCDYHFSLSAGERIDALVDPGTFKPLFKGMKTKNNKAFPGYDGKLQKAEKQSGLKEAVVCGYGEIRGHRLALAVMDTSFMMGSMGSVVGEKITRTIEKSMKHQIPLLIICCSGGARMQEGVQSLMQMAKVSAALKKHDRQGLLSICLLTNPTTGGVTASFAMLGDILIAEPKALIGFAGPRVIQQTIRQELPEGFQSSEFLLSRGFLDKIVPRDQLRDSLSTILALHGGDIR